MTRPGRLLLAALAALAAPGGLAAQWSASVDATVVDLEQERINRATAVAGGLRVDYAGARTSLASSLLAAWVPDGRWTGQALLGVERRSRPGRFEVVGGLGASAFAASAGGSAGSGAAALGAELALSPALSLVARAEGAGRILASRVTPALTLEGGLAAGDGRGGLRLMARHVRARDLVLLRLIAPGTVTLDGGRFPALAFTEGEAALSLRQGPLRVELVGGVRGAGGRFRDPRFYGSGEVTVQLAPPLALTGAIARRLEDPVRGLPETIVYAAGLRWTPGARRPARAVPASAAPLVRVEREGAIRRLVVEAAGASTVDVRGDLSGWEPQPLERGADGRWRSGALPSGRVQFVVRVDGGAWQVPRGATRLLDDFEGEVGALVIP